MVLKRKSKRLEQVFLGKLIKKGLRSKSEKILFNCFKGLSSGDAAGVNVFTAAVERVVPLIDLKSKKVSGTFYRIPIYLEKRRGISKGINWLLSSVRSRKGGTMSKKLTEELQLAQKNQGAAVARLEELYKAGSKNRGLVKFL